jgi:YfiH family protein
MLEQVQHSSGAVAFRSPALARLGAPHLFTTRVGAGGERLDLGKLDDRTRGLLRELGQFPAAAPLVSIRQIHGAHTVVVDGAELAPDTSGDALVSSRPDRALLIYTADCVPVLVASARATQVAAIHAGWRGLVAGVIPAALRALGAPAAAAIGPCLSPACCEVGPEVVEQFERADLHAAILRPTGAKARVDLRLAARLQLERAGCPQIDVSSDCTYSQPERYPSHRRDVTHGGAPRAGRIGALIAAAG